MKLIVSGQKYSGSGALLDWLKGIENIIVSPIRIIPFEPVSYGLRIGQMINQTDKKKKFALIERQIFESKKMTLRLRCIAFANSVPVLFDAYGAIKKIFRRQPLKGARGIHASTGTRPDIATIKLYLYWLETYRQKLEHGPFDETGFWKKWLDKAVAPIQGNHEHIALDKGIPFTQFELRELWEALYSPFKMILVHRDTGDKLAENIRQLGWAEFLHSTPKEQQVKHQLDQIEFELSCYEKLVVLDPNRYLALPFEGFVADFPSWESKLASWLFDNNVSYRQNMDRPYFDPNKSKLNVGILSQNPELLKLLSLHDEQMVRIKNIRERLNSLSLQR